MSARRRIALPRMSAGAPVPRDHIITRLATEPKFALLRSVFRKKRRSVRAERPKRTVPLQAEHRPEYGEPATPATEAD